MYRSYLDTRKTSYNADLSYTDLTERLQINAIIYLRKEGTGTEQRAAVA
jgi:hypothetical protein